MTKYKIVCLSVVALIGLAPGQSSKPLSSSAKSGSDPLKTATKPLTPKSAMPSHRKTGAVAPKPATNSSKTTGELTRLERGKNIKSDGAKNSSTVPAKSAVAKSPATATGTSSGNGSGIDFKYKKPAGGLQATNAGANAKGSSTPRVTKQK
jgi:hypothetical protein